MGAVVAVSSAVAHSWHCDHYGHMNTRQYAALFDDAIFLFWGRLGAAGGEAPSVVPVTAEMKSSFLKEVTAGTLLDITATVVRIGGKSVSLRFEMVEMNSREAVATCEIVEVFFDSRTRSSHVIPTTIKARLTPYLDSAP